MGSPLWEQLDELEEYRQLGRVRTDHVVPVREPMLELRPPRGPRVPTPRAQKRR